MKETKLPLRYAGLLLLGFLVACSDDDSDAPVDAGTTATNEATNEMGEESNLPAGTPTTVRSSFDDGMADGWSITGIESAIVSTDGICGLVEVDPNPGFLCADANEEGGTSYYVAPEKFNGDLNVFSSLNFSLVANGGSYYDSGFGFDGDISISNGVSRASYTFSEDQRPTDEWKSYQILLNDTENWVVDDGADLAIVLQSVTELRIRAEYGVGSDNAGLDDVSLE